jgi:hypothetical protein
MSNQFVRSCVIQSAAVGGGGGGQIGKAVLGCSWTCGCLQSSASEVGVVVCALVVGADALIDGVDGRNDVVRDGMSSVSLRRCT